MAYDLTGDGIEELILILCPIMDNMARCDVYIFSLDEAADKAVGTLAAAGSLSSAPIDRNAASYLHIPDCFAYQDNGVTVNRFCIGADVTEAGDVPYLRILHGIYPGGYDRAGSTEYSYSKKPDIVWFFVPESKLTGDAGAPGAIRTRCLMLRRHTLYPSELRAPVLL